MTRKREMAKMLGVIPPIMVDAAKAILAARDRYVSGVTVDWARGDVGRVRVSNGDRYIDIDTPGYGHGWSIASWSLTNEGIYFCNSEFCWSGARALGLDRPVTWSTLDEAIDSAVSILGNVNTIRQAA